MKGLFRALLFCALIVSYPSLRAVSQAGAIFLLISPSPSMTALGDIGVSLPSNDTYAAYYNPANGIAPFHGLSLSRSSATVPWLRSFVKDMTYSYEVTNLALPLGQLMSGWGFPPLNLVFSKHNTYLDLGEQDRTDEYGRVIETFSSWVRADALTAGVRTEAHFRGVPIHLSIGATRKKAIQNFGGPGGSDSKSSTVLYDYGLLVSLPLFYENISRLDEMIHIGFSPSFGYSVSNIGGKIVFDNVDKADPSPRFARIGLSSTFVMSVKSRLTIVEWMGGRAASDLLVESKAPHDYQPELVGDISFFQHVVRNHPDSMVEIHRGDQWTFLDFYSVRIGRRIDTDGLINLSTSGYGYRLKGLLNVLFLVFEDPTYRKISEFLDIQYNTSRFIEAPGHPLDNTRYESLTLTLQNLDRLVARIIGGHQGETR